MITLSKQKNVAAWSLLVLLITFMEIYHLPLLIMIKSSLKSLDHLAGCPEIFNLPLSPSLYQMTTTTFSITLGGKHLNHLLIDHITVLTRNSLEEKPSAPAPAVTITALHTLPTIMDTLNDWQWIFLLFQRWPPPHWTHLYHWTIPKTHKYAIIPTFTYSSLWITLTYLWKIILPWNHLHSTKLGNSNRLWSHWS